jgi:hypothetical protein
MKPNNGYFVESAIVFGLEVRVQGLVEEPDADNENMIRVDKSGDRVRFTMTIWWSL